MLSRPLSPLRNTTRKRPPPGGVSLLVSQWTRNPPLSLVEVSVCLSPRPAQLRIGFPAPTACGAGRGVSARQPPSSTSEARHAWRISNAKFLLPNSLQTAHHAGDLTAEAG